LNNESLFVVTNSSALNEEDATVNFFVPLQNRFLKAFPVAGNVIFLKKKTINIYSQNPGYEYDDITAEDLSYIETLLSNNFQMQLKESRPALAANIY